MKRKGILLLSLFLSINSFAQNLMHFNNWLVGCDNTGRCTMVGFPEADAKGKAFIKITRDGPPTTLPTIMVIAKNDIATVGQKLSLSFQPGINANIETELLTQGRKYLKGELSLDASKDFMKGMNQSQSITIKTINGDAINISLLGAIGALTYMDDKQQNYKAASSQAIEVSDASSIVQGAPILPPQAKQMKILHGELPPLPTALLPYKASTGACSGEDAPKGIVAVLSESETLWGLCKSVKQFNVEYAFFIVNNGQAKLASFEAPPGEPDLHGVLTNPDISNEDRVLSSFTMASQQGDCGILGEWIWTGDNFRLFNYRKMTDCRGLYDTEDWPSLYKAKNDKNN